MSDGWANSWDWEAATSSLRHSIPEQAIDDLTARAYSRCLLDARASLEDNPLADRVFLTTGFQFDYSHPWAHIHGAVPIIHLGFWNMSQQQEVSRHLVLSEVEFLVEEKEAWVVAIVLEVESFDLHGGMFTFVEDRLKLRLRSIEQPKLIIADLVLFSQELFVFIMLYSDVEEWIKKCLKGTRDSYDLHQGVRNSEKSLREGV